MKPLLPVLLLFSHISFSQTITYYDYKWEKTDIQYARFFSVVAKEDSLWHKQDFYISDKKIQMSGWYKDQAAEVEHGMFYYFYPDGSVEEAGAYVNGKRQGIWLHYHWNGMIADSAMFHDGEKFGLSMSWHPNGMIADSSIWLGDRSGVKVSWFDNGMPSLAGLYGPERKKRGKWKYFHRNGQLSVEEEYIDDKLMSAKYYDENGVAATKVDDKEAAFPGGNKKWEKHTYSNVYFPSHLKITNSNKAVVVVNFVIGEDGAVEDAWVSVPFHPDFDRIVLDAVRKSPKWIPAVKNNRKVKAYFRQPMTFADHD